MKTVLSIDDDLIVRKTVSKALEGQYNVILAENGEQGIAKAIGKLPDVILLDIEMPDRNGYEVCEYLRHHETTKDIPIVFISAKSDVGERMRGYEVGATDFMPKPFQKEDVLAKLRVLISLKDQQDALQAQIEEAEKTAHTAMSGSSELGMVMQFVERSYEINDYQQLASGIFKVLTAFGLNTAMRITTDAGAEYYSCSGTVSPLESELMSLLKERSRFNDFGCRTQINYPNVSILIKNMPLDDPERYGRYKDIIPAILSAADAKIRTLNTEKQMQEQTNEINMAFTMIRESLLTIANRQRVNQQEGQKVLHSMVNELASELPGMGLEVDQEERILTTVDKAVKESFDLNDESEIIKKTLDEVSKELEILLNKQNEIMAHVLERKKRPDEFSDDLMSVELF